MRHTVSFPFVFILFTIKSSVTARRQVMLHLQSIINCTRSRHPYYETLFFKNAMLLYVRRFMLFISCWMEEKREKYLLSRHV
jgi:hypothetical protein